MSSATVVEASRSSANEDSPSFRRSRMQRRPSLREVLPAATLAVMGASSMQELAITQKLKKDLAKGSQELLDKNYVWRLKTYYIFPVVGQLRHLDHISRFCFPTAYFIFLLVHFAEVDPNGNPFGGAHRELLRSQMACFKENGGWCTCKSESSSHTRRMRGPPSPLLSIT